MPAGKKTACGACGQVHRSFYDRKTRRVRDLSCGDTRVYLEVEIRRVDCRTVRRGEAGKLGLAGRQSVLHQALRLLRGPALSERRRSRMSPRKLRLDWKTVKALEMQYMREQLRRAGTPAPKVIGIDEISIRKGHTYRIVVSDLVRRPADLVRGHGPVRAEHGPVLRSGWARKDAARSAWR